MIKKGLFASSVILILMFVISTWAHIQLPEDASFPIQWGADGKVNRYAGKDVLVWFVPFLTLFLSACFALAPMIAPRKANLQSSRKFYLIAWIGGLALTLVVHFVILYSALTGAAPLIEVILIMNGAFLCVLGNAMAKSRSNWFAGIRTPWTLSSEHSWSVTHRFAGRGFIATGIAMIACTLIGISQISIYLAIGGLGATVTVSVCLSYFAWRSDPDRLA